MPQLPLSTWKISWFSEKVCRKIGDVSFVRLSHLLPGCMTEGILGSLSYAYGVKRFKKANRTHTGLAKSGHVVSNLQSLWKTMHQAMYKDTQSAHRPQPSATSSDCQDCSFTTRWQSWCVKLFLCTTNRFFPHYYKGNVLRIKNIQTFTHTHLLFNIFWYSQDHCVCSVNVLWCALSIKAQFSEFCSKFLFLRSRRNFSLTTHADAKVIWISLNKKHEKNDSRGT